MDSLSEKRKKKKTVAIVHENRIFRESLVWFFSRQEDFEIIELDYTDKNGIGNSEKDLPDIILIDLNISDNYTLELIIRFRKISESLKILLVTDIKDSWDYLFLCIRAGANGCISQQLSLKELVRAVNEVFLRGEFFSHDITSLVFTDIAEGSLPCLIRERSRIRLTFREIEVLRLVGNGMLNKQIAKKLSLSIYTIKNHIHNICKKLSAGNRFEAFEKANKGGLLLSVEKLDKRK